eukprot:Em0012g929a
MLEVKDHMGIGSPQSCMERKSTDLTLEVKDNVDEEKNAVKRKRKRKRTNKILLGVLHLQRPIPHRVEASYSY